MAPISGLGSSMDSYQLPRSLPPCLFCEARRYRGDALKSATLTVVRGSARPTQAPPTPFGSRETRQTEWGLCQKLPDINLVDHVLTLPFHDVGIDHAVYRSREHKPTEKSAEVSRAGVISCR